LGVCQIKYLAVKGGRGRVIGYVAGELRHNLNKYGTSVVAAEYNNVKTALIAAKLGTVGWRAVNTLPRIIE
jgi:hypothetical protein